MTPERGAKRTYISVTEPVEPLGSTLYLFDQLYGSFGSVGDRHKTGVELYIGEDTSIINTL